MERIYDYHEAILFQRLAFNEHTILNYIKNQDHKRVDLDKIETTSGRAGGFHWLDILNFARNHFKGN